MFYIRSFGNDRQCKDLSDLRDTLSKHYAGMSVSVVFEGPHGLMHTDFVNVDQQGVTRYSYGDQGLYFEFQGEDAG